MLRDLSGRAEDAGDRDHGLAAQPAALRLAAQYHEGQEEAALREKTPADFGADITPRLTVLKTEEPGGRKAGVSLNLPMYFCVRQALALPCVSGSYRNDLQEIRNA
jgi:hypothetical protein